MKMKHFLPFTGLWMLPFLIWLTQVCVSQLEKHLPIPPVVAGILTYGLPWIFPIVVTLTNLGRAKRGQTDFSFSSVYGLGDKEPRHSRAYLDAAYPRIPERYTSRIPKDLVLGKHRGSYVCCPLSRDGINVFCVGTPGSGKSVLLLGWLYAQKFRNVLSGKRRTPPGRPYNVFLVDIKGELFEKLLGIKACDYTAEAYPDFQVIAPGIKNAFGYDVFYKIHREDASETDIIKAITDIADALVPPSGDNPYFSDNAKKILTGVLYYFARQGYDFLPIIQTLMRSNLDELLTAVVEDARQKQMGVVLDKLQGFCGKSDNESVADIETTLKTHLDAFSYPELGWILQDHPNRTSPAVLNNGRTCLDLAISESMLMAYAPFFRLVTMQVLRHCESEFHEDDDRYTMLIFDEAARIGTITGMDAAMSTLRSKHTALICLFQSISQFRDIYPGEKAQTLLNLCELKLFLSGSGDKDTTDYVSAMAGEYEATKMTYQRKGALGTKSNGSYSTERRAIIEARDLMELRERGEAIIFLYGRYMRCKKLRYFEDPYIAPLVAQQQKPEPPSREHRGET